MILWEMEAAETQALLEMPWGSEAPALTPSGQSQRGASGPGAGVVVQGKGQDWV